MSDLTPARSEKPIKYERVEGANRVNKHSKFSLFTKLGLLAICALGIGLIFILASLGFLWFLWLAGDKNHVWRALVVRNWVNRTIALMSLTIRQSVSFHASAATAMIAALAIEHTTVLLLNLASVSTTRNANAGPYMLFWWVWKAFCFNPGRWKTIYLPILVTILASTTILLQLTSFALLSDVDLVVVRGSSESKPMLTNFEYSQSGTIPVITHGSTWSQQLQSYVSFAEYHEPPSNTLPDGVDDTGLTMRAFIPIVDQQARSMVASWEGLATVLDARTVCIRPTLLEPRVHFADESLALETGFILNSSAYDPKTLGLESIAFPNASCPFGDCPEAVACMLPLTAVAGNGSYVATQSQFSQWRLAICQPSGAEAETLFVLQSEFQTSGQETRRGSVPNYSFGNAYLVVNVSSGSEAEWAEAVPGEDPNLGIFRGAGTPPLAYSFHGQKNEWYDLIYSEDGKLNLSVSVCYTAFDTADLNVKIESSGNHSDLTPSWLVDTNSFDYGKIRAQLGQDADGSVSYSRDLGARNIMSLEKRDSWLPQPDFGDYVIPSHRVTETSWITDYANMAGSLQSNTFNYAPGDNQTRIMWQSFQLNDLWPEQMSYAYADTSLIDLVQEILQSGGPLSFAMQSIVTVLTEIAYYQQLQQLNGISNVTKSTYVLVSAPVKNRGLLAVSIVLGVHILVVFCFILPTFLQSTKISALGNAWQAVAQLNDPKLKPILDKTQLATDSEAEQEVKILDAGGKKLGNHKLVGLYSPEGQSVRLRTVGNEIGPDCESNLAVTSAPVTTSSENHEDVDLIEHDNETASEPVDAQQPVEYRDGEHT